MQDAQRALQYSLQETVGTPAEKAIKKAQAKLQDAFQDTIGTPAEQAMQRVQAEAKIAYFSALSDAIGKVKDALFPEEAPPVETKRRRPPRMTMTEPVRADRD